jgi:GNAT superfamily N-acetyltransferase
MADWTIEPLADHHDRAAFDCGKPPLDDWIRRHVGQYQRRDLARAYVLVRPDQPRVHGCYAISNRHIDFAQMPSGWAKKLPQRLPLSAVLIGQLAVDRSVQGQGLGDVLLVDALGRILALADQVGVLAVVVDAIDDQGPRILSPPGFSAVPG